MRRRDRRWRRHIGVRFARADELRHLVELREVSRLAASGHLDADAGQVEEIKR